MTQHTDDLSATVERAFSTVDLNTPLEQVMGRGQRLRTRRRAAAGGVLAVAVAAVALAVPLSQIGGSAPRAAAESRQAVGPGVNVDLAAFSVHNNPDGTVSVTVRQLFEPAALSTLLTKAGVPSVVTVHNGQPKFYCGGGTAKVTRLLSQTVAHGSGGAILTIRPSLIPPGGKIEFDYIFSPSVNGAHPTVAVSFRGVAGDDECPGGPTH